ncbi:TIGR02444 family protein [Marinobacterium sp. YM272]|uniref:TIGR02444 family protein n=1 Tax=Marinobacterium sp. YM272 TaxID=3421654 RepID=UPI003D7F8C15
MSLDNPLWQYALDLYSRPGVESTALDLQTVGCSVNRLILACYLAEQGRLLPAELLAGEALSWQRELTHPLRVLRYQVRSLKAGRPELENCYRKMRQAELACEQVEIMLLWEMLSETVLPVAEAGPALARANIERVVAEVGAEAVVQASVQIDAFIDAACPDPLASG